MYNKNITIIIPCYRVKTKILKVLSKIPSWISKIICVDDFCPEESGKFIESNNNDKRVMILFNEKNLGVGGATMVGFNKALELGADIVVKVDGDNQMDLKYLPDFINPILSNEADFTKGNRFTKFTDYQSMPVFRKVGNIFFSFINRFASGYWNIFDTTNGYLCMNAKLIELLPLKKISKNFFFESDLLNWLYIVRAKVKDVPIKAVYANEKSNINILSVIFNFPILYIRNFFRRFLYEYCLRNPDTKFISFIFGSISLIFGISFSLIVWKTNFDDIPSSSGTVAISLISILVGINLLSSFFASDLNNHPKKNLFWFK